MSEWMPEPALGQRRFQVCERCWYVRKGGGGRLPERMAGAIRQVDVTPCALCGKDTDSGHYMPLYDREVRTTVPVLFLDGPREGDHGVTVRMCDQLHDTFDAAGTPVRYTLELIGPVQHARMAEVQRTDEVHGDGIIRS